MRKGSMKDKTPALVIALRPNGIVFDSRQSRWDAVEVTANDMRGAIRNERGWTPMFRILDGTQDVTGLFRVNDRP